MATINDVILTGLAYQNVYALTGITSGTAITIQNKTSSNIYLQNLSVQPDSASNNGHIIPPLGVTVVDGTVVGLWARGNGPISVEVIG